MKASGRMQLTAESRRQTLGELTQQLCRPCRGSSRWAAVAVAWGHWGFRTAPTQQQEEGRRAGQCQGLDEAVVQLTKLVQQNQVSLDRVLLAMRAAWCVSQGAVGVCGRQWVDRSCPCGPQPLSPGLGLPHPLMGLPPRRPRDWPPWDPARPKGPCDHTLSSAPWVLETAARLTSLAQC